MTEFVKNDAGKPRYSLVPHEALEAIARVMTLGAEKYADHNWRKATEWNRYYDAAMRHLTAWQRGEELDPETGEPHLAHAGCCVMMLLSLCTVEAGKDDRYREAELPDGTAIVTTDPKAGVCAHGWLMTEICQQCGRDSI